MVRLGVLYTPNHGSSPCEQTMKTEITESIINHAQSLYDKVGNIKKVRFSFFCKKCLKLIISIRQYTKKQLEFVAANSMDRLKNSA